MISGKIYKIIATLKDFDEADTYYGSTTTTLDRRMNCHKIDYKNWQTDGILKCTSIYLFNKYGVNNCSIILLKEVEVETKKQLKDMEAIYIISNNCINKYIPNRTAKQWYQDNIEKVREKHRQHYNNKKDYYTEKHDCECGGNFTTKNKACHFKTKKHQEYLEKLNNSKAI